MTSTRTVESKRLPFWLEIVVVVLVCAAIASFSYVIVDDYRHDHRLRLELILFDILAVGNLVASIKRIRAHRTEPNAIFTHSEATKE